MGKPHNERTHKRSVDSQNSRMSAEAIRRNKCELSKSRNARRHAEANAEAVERNEAWREQSFEEQLQQLDWRLGKGQGAVKQRARIAKAIQARDEATAEKQKVEKNRKNRKRQKQGT